MSDLLPAFDEQIGRATDRQIDYLEALGVPRAAGASMSKDEACERIADLSTRTTAPQLAMLQRFKVAQEDIDRLDKRTAELVIGILIKDKKRRKAEERAKKLAKKKIKCADLSE